MSVLVISGTSTDVGKTVVTAALAAALRAAGQSLGCASPHRPASRSTNPVIWRR
ncbi:AAA family ATPase [Rhodococcus hoagii]|nr:AAA family ATPase [Prescottella equi]